MNGSIQNQIRASVSSISNNPPSLINLCLCQTPGNFFIKSDNGKIIYTLNNHLFFQIFGSFFRIMFLIFSRWP